MKIPRINKKIVLAILVVLLGIGIYVILHWGEESTDDAAIEAHVVTLAPRVNGYVTRLFIDDNSKVKQGDVLLEIDARDYTFRRNRAASLLDKQSGGMDALTALVEATQANWQKAQNDLKRMQRLGDEARSREELDAAIGAEKTARSNYEDARAKLKSAVADLDQADKDLNDTKIMAPQDGIITRKAVEKGDYVQAGQQIGYLVGKHKWVIANFKETQLTKMKIGDEAKIEIDAYPKLKMKGRVESFQEGTGGRFSAFPPENATGNFVKIVQRVPVKIVLDDDEPDANNRDIGVGMSVIATVYTK